MSILGTEHFTKQSLLLLLLHKDVGGKEDSIAQAIEEGKEGFFILDRFLERFNRNAGLEGDERCFHLFKFHNEEDRNWLINFFNDIDLRYETMSGEELFEKVGINVLDN